MLVLLDLKLPRLDGLDVLRQLKSRPETRQIPVLVFSADDDPRLIADCYDLGCGLYLQKPLLEWFLGAIERLAGLIRAVSIPCVAQGHAVFAGTCDLSASQPGSSDSSPCAVTRKM